MLKNSRSTYAEINIDNYLHNLEYISKKTNTEVMPVLKADAYGHNKITLAKCAVKEGYKRFAVAFLEEALDLINNDIKKPILIFNYINPKSLKRYTYFSDFLIPTIHSLNNLKTLISELGEEINKFKFHLNFNTGINRIGIQENEIENIIAIIKNKNINIEGIYSHYATADSLDDYVDYQYNNFLRIIKIFKDREIEYKFKHMSNSAACLYYPERSLDIVRPGIASFGLQPSNIKKDENIKPVMELKSIVAKINTCKKGDTIGYGRTHIIDKNSKTAIIPIGYADGYPRILSNKSHVLIKNKLYKVIGNVSMDQIVIEIKDDDIMVGDEVILFGKKPSAEHLANLANTLNYEITCGVSSRVPRVFIKGGSYFE
ncbi:alanine racemase [Geotoga petraea]|jgi:alanine racemase|uniref:Alanine racemase n=1 Tax=Geotoga petraea TaxID=28234 RepID=A0A1G6K8U9_9BACT|nr:alanine racemase [Geotoga petraea]MDK2945999.1 alanine racemase [Geotoga sp.]TGG88466.1 alanine racemase [Geotoga petraea]SDC27492.1 alanine racemase [Geotoga petraea]